MASDRFILEYAKIPSNGTGTQASKDEGGYRPEDVIEWAAWILFGLCAIIIIGRCYWMKRRL